jgi:hypothetical protein
MNDWDAVPVFVRMICAFFAAFPAIALWSKTRDAAWVFMVLGALFLFIDALYSTLVMIGLATYELSFVPGIPVLKSALTGLPAILFGVGFLVFLFRNRRY